MGISAEMKAVVLLSGGIDSTTVLALAAVDQGYQAYCLSFDYGQRNAIELDAARAVAKSLGAREHMMMSFNMRKIGGSALTSEIEVPHFGKVGDIGSGIPVTYVPARNTIFLSFALAWSEVVEARDIFIGVNAVDSSGYPDCGLEYLEAFEQAARLGTRSGVEGTMVKIRAPLLQLSKAEIIKLGTRLGVDYSLTQSCYDPTEEGLACGECESCLLRKKGFAGAGLTDPAGYAT